MTRAAKEWVARLATTMPLDDVDVFLDIAEESVTVFEGVNRPLAVAYYTLHLMELRNRPHGASGAVTDAQEGSIRMSFSEPQSKSDLCLTTWGVMYQRVIRKAYSGGIAMRAGVMPADAGY